MFSRQPLKRCPLPLVIILVLAWLSCGRPESAIQKIGLVPLENLSSDSALDWIGYVIPYVMASQSIGAEDVVVQQADTGWQGRAWRTDFVVEGYYVVKGGKLRVAVNRRDQRRQRVAQRAEVEAPLDQGMIPLIAPLTAAVTGGRRELQWGRPDVIELLGRALAAGDAKQKLELAHKAAQAEPKLTPAALVAAQLSLNAGDTASSGKVLEMALASQPGGWEHFQLARALAAVQRDPEALLKALQEGIRHTPNDPGLTRQLAELHLGKHDHNRAAQWFQRTAELEPEVPANWNSLAYSYAYGRRFPEAKAAVQRYLKLASADPNVYDTMGELHLMGGEFREASEQFLEAQRRDPQFLGGLEFSKAAFATFLGGDRTAADQLFARYIESRRALKDAYAEIRHAHWLYLTGRTEGAFQAIRRLTSAEGEVGSRANAFLTAWLVEEGKNQEAGETARKAASLARSPISANMAMICMFLAQPRASASEWQSRADRAFVSAAAASVKNPVLAYALLLNGHVAEAATIWERLYRETPPTLADEVRILLGGAKATLGDRAAAAALLANYPLPPQPGEALFASLYFRPLRKWRSQAGLP